MAALDAAVFNLGTPAAELTDLRGETKAMMERYDVGYATVSDRGQVRSYFS